MLRDDRGWRGVVGKVIGGIGHDILSYEADQWRDLERAASGDTTVPELAGPVQRPILPEELEVLLEQIASHGPEFIAHQIGQRTPPQSPAEHQ